jgi:serine/threonine protein kinase
MRPGERIGSYEITSTLGEGGMGIVFRARDTALQRDVALKALPEKFIRDADRLVRFKREAQILASLNHPNIAQIYGLEQANGSNCIVMELVEGETLAERIRRGPVPLEEAMDIAKQVIAALDAAHEKGVVHRDLKPANIKRTPDGKVKVLDFGLAKTFAGEMPGGNLSDSPTTITGSVVGTILGTAVYMSPEQARGRAVDKRSDIWAFGCVLYEMLTGTRPFNGIDANEILGAVIHKEPDFDRVPASMRPLVRHCLEKNPERRLRDIGDAAALIEHAPGGGQQAEPRSRLAWATAAVFVIATGIFSALYFLKPSPAAELMTFQIPAPNDVEFEPNNISISQDGSRLAFLAQGADKIVRIWIRSVDSLDAHPLAGTEGSGAPFWSPDGRFIGFGLGNQLKKIEVSSGFIVPVCTSLTPVGSGAWTKDDVILFGGRGSGMLQQVHATGGAPVAVTSLRAPRGSSHSFPSLLPDGRHFYYTVLANPDTRGVYLGSLDTPPEKQDTSRLLDFLTNAAYAPGPDSSTGYMLYVRNATLMAQQFDLKKMALRAEAVPVAEQIAKPNATLGIFSLSANGRLAFRAGSGTAITPVLAGRNGQDIIRLTASPLHALNPRLSPDGKRLALIVDQDLWVYDLEGRPPIKLTFGGVPASPVWTRDGKRIIYEVNRPVELKDVSGKPFAIPVGSLVSIAADGSSTLPEPASPAMHLHPSSWTPAGELVAAAISNNTDVVSFMPTPAAAVQSIVNTPASEGRNGLSLSPDGHWLAYASDTTGSLEIWVKPYGQPGAPIRISPNGGVEPTWDRSGHELFYIQGARMMSVVVETRSAFTFKPPVALFEGVLPPAGEEPPSYDVAPDGRFLLLRSTTTAATPITLILNWTAKLKH